MVHQKTLTYFNYINCTDYKFFKHKNKRIGKEGEHGVGGKPAHIVPFNALQRIEVNNRDADIGRPIGKQYDARRQKQLRPVAHTYDTENGHNA